MSLTTVTTTVTTTVNTTVNTTVSIISQPLSVMSPTPLAIRQAPQREEHPLPLEKESAQDSPSNRPSEPPSRKFVVVRCQDCKHYKIKNKHHKCPGPKSVVVPCNVTENNPIGGDNEQAEHQ
jgi:ribosomal protein S27E